MEDILKEKYVQSKEKRADDGTINNQGAGRYKRAKLQAKKKWYGVFSILEIESVFIFNLTIACRVEFIVAFMIQTVSPNSHFMKLNRF